MSNILENDSIVKEFKKTNIERLGAIMKSAGIKGKDLAIMLENDVLNKRTRKLFLNSLMEQESTRKIVNIQKRIKKLNVPLENFF